MRTVDAPTTDAITIPERMRAVVQDRYGTAEVLRHGELPVPSPRPRQVLVEVIASGVDRGTVHQVTGLPHLVRLAGYGVRRPGRPTPGLDGAGRVVAVGTEVTRFDVGDRVFGFFDGSLARYAVADESRLARTPELVIDEHAAVAAVSGITALQALTSVGGLEADERVLVIGASGAVGSFATQIAVALGGRVTGVAGTANLDLVRALGAEAVVDHTTTDVTASPGSFDLIVDTGGRTPVRRLRRILGPTGRLVLVGGEGGNRITGGIGRQLRAMVLSRLVTQTLTTFVSEEHHRHLDRLAALMSSGEVTPVIGQRYPFDYAIAAIEDVAAGRAHGKTLITVST